MLRPTNGSGCQQVQGDFWMVGHATLSPFWQILGVWLQLVEAPSDGARCYVARLAGPCRIGFPADAPFVVQQRPPTDEGRFVDWSLVVA